MAAGRIRRDGRIRVHLDRASGLRAADSNGHSDPYITLVFGGRTEQSEVVRKTLNPFFGWDFLFSFDSLETALAEVLNVEAWDWDRYSFHDPLGFGFACRSFAILRAVAFA